MEEVRSYLISIIASCIICGVILQISSVSGGRKDVLRLICGLFLTVTVIRPIASIQIDALTADVLAIDTDARAAIAQGEDFARDTLGDIIKQETEAYILDKAQSLNAAIIPEVVLSDRDPPIPQEVYLRGSISPGAKQTLQKILAEEIGIGKEKQIWIP